MDTTLSDPMVGRLLEGRYTVEAFVARGGMAAVYLATDTRLDRRVAVKVLRSELSDDPMVVARFEREARAAAQLSHPDVVAVYDQGSDNGNAFLVMEFVPGANLREVLRDRGRLKTGEAITVMDHVLAALSAAHAAGLVHRDVKPENVLIAPDGRVKVADFGLARAVAGSTVTTAGSVLFGTAHYFAPERFDDESADARSDVYSAGVLFFELLTGATPFTAENNMALLKRYSSEDIPAPSSRASGIPPQIDALVGWATSRDPSQRPVDAAELHASLLDVRDKLGLHERVPALPSQLTAPLLAAATVASSDVTQHMPGGRPPAAGAPAVARPRRPRRRRRGLIISVILLLVVAAAAIGGWWFAAGRYTNAPSVVGLSKSAADAKLKAAGLHWRWLPPVHSLTTTAGLVAVETNGGRVTHGSTVDLALSSGPRTHPLPPVAGYTVDHATTVLKNLDISVAHTTREFSTEVRKGLVLATKPGENKVEKEGSSVTLVISKGLQHVAIPTVNHLSQQDATTALQQAGFQIGAPIQRFSSTVPNGTVISSTPPQGKVVVKGRTVSLIVSQGPKLFAVPNVEGDSVGDAVHAIKAAGFTPDPEQFAPDGPGTVFRETPTGMQQRGTKITLDWF
ncbi:MAG TPA: Stk1 family PASTA domain-containing Ser/Thr kinase [Mycobacteriales bacterium]|nr:Stk1 family PASTA domain-containing Ser/Thr kinase [Mycobacteriales bacterium]